MLVGPLVLDLHQHRSWLHGEAIYLPAREFAILEYLMQRPETIVTPQALVQLTHGIKTDDDEASTLVRPLIRALRRRLGNPFCDGGCIENVRGLGYRLTLSQPNPALSVE